MSFFITGIIDHKNFGEQYNSLNLMAWSQAHQPGKKMY